MISRSARTQFTIRYSGRGTGVLRTETAAFANAASAIALVKRRLSSSDTFQEARLFEDDECRFRISTGSDGPVISGGEPGRSPAE